MTPPVLAPLGTEEMVGCTKRIGIELGILSQWEKVLFPEKEEAVRDLLGQTSINISTQGQNHLTAVLGSRSYREEYVSEKVDD